MLKRTGSVTLLEEGPLVLGSSAVGGKKEAEGPLGGCFDFLYSDPRAGQKSWEKAETAMQDKAVSLALKKSGLSASEVDLLLNGDLVNQCTPSCYTASKLGIPLAGLFGACSTAAESLGLGALLVESGALRTALCVTSSHFCTAERQFRTPLAYGAQRAPSAQWTVTGAGAFVLGQGGGRGVRLRAVCFGRPIDMGVTDASNMGAAMAPAACDTFSRFFTDSSRSPSDFDLILTGDLGQIGHRIVSERMEQLGLPLGDRYNDCGLMVYDLQRQDMHAGGSGCGCSAVVLAGDVLSRMRAGTFKNVLLAGTGALMSPMSLQQGDSIVGVAHLVWLSCE